MDLWVRGRLGWAPGSGFVLSSEMKNIDLGHEEG